MSPSRAARLPRPTDRHEVRGLSVSPFCLGMTHIEDLSHAFSLGFNFFFLSADMHWPLYEGTRRAIERLLANGVPRRDIVVACASYVAQPEFCFAPFHEVVAAVPGLEYLDVAVMGGVYPENFLARRSIYVAHREERFEGISAVGASFHDRSVARAAMEGGLVDLGFVRYNAEHDGAAREVFPFAAAGSKPLLYCFKSTGGYVPDAALDAARLPREKWRPAVVDHYRFVLSRAAVDGVLCTLASNVEVDALCSALDEGPMTEEEEQYVVGLAHLGAGRARLGG